MRTQQVRIGLTILAVAGVAGCGGADGAADNTSITFNPAGYTWKNTSPTAGCYQSSTALVQIVLKTDAGVPLNDTTLTLNVDGGRVTLYNDANNNLILDAGELTPVGPTFTTKTESFGTKNVFIQVDLGGTGCTSGTAGLAYTTTIGVFSGNNYGQFENTITSD